MKIRVVLADDHHLVRKGFRALLEREADIEVVGEAADGREAMQIAEQSHADVLVTDLEMPGMSGLEALRQIKERRLPLRVLVLTLHRDAEHILPVIRAGAAGYVLKDAAPAELVEGIRSASRGEVYLSPAVSCLVVTKLLDLLDKEETTSPIDTLTAREREIWQLIAEGRSRREIAELLSISPRTFDIHRANLMQKLNVTDNAALVRLAIQHGIVSASSP